jgi:hypothetical protein
VHLLDTGVAGYSVKVEKSHGGDYFVTALHEHDPAGGEVDYAPTLAAAKRRAETVLADGSWTDLTNDPDAAEAAAASVCTIH